MQELGTLCFTCAPLTFNVLPVKEHPLRNYLLSETSKASIFKLFGMRKKKTLNILILGLHTVHWVANSVTYLVCKLFISAGEALPDIPVLLPLDHTWSPNSFSQKIWIYVQMQDTFSEMKPLRWSGLVTHSLTHSQTKSCFWGFTLDVDDANPKLVCAVPVADVDIEGSVKHSCNFR